jgi:hypothetical protein
MEIDVIVRSAKDPMFKPLRLSDPDVVAERLQRGRIAGFICRVVDTEDDVDERLGGQFGDRSRPDMSQEAHTIAEGGADTRGLMLISSRPIGVVVAELDTDTGHGSEP